MTDQNMKHIAAKGINSAYVTSNGIILFGKDKTSQKILNAISMHMKGYLKSNEQSKTKYYIFFK